MARSWLARLPIELLVVTVLFTVFYAYTAIVYVEGGFEQYLVIKPEPGWGFAFGGGEDGSWVRHHPNEHLPWWLKRDYVVLISGDWEGGRPGWETLYVLGFLVVPVLWLLYIGTAIVRAILRLRNRWLAGRAAS